MSIFLGRWARAPPVGAARARALVVDLDETLVRRPRGALDAALMYGAPFVTVGVPYSGAAEGVRALRTRGVGVVAVTARWRLAEASTERMLVAAGVERTPVVYAGGWHPGDASRAAFKARALRHLRAAGWALAAGVGDRASDVRAYAAEDVPALAVVHAEGEPRGAPAPERLDALLRTERALRDAAAAAHAPPPRVIFFTDCARAAARAGLAQFRAGEPPPNAPGALFRPARDGASVWAQLEEFLGRGGCGLGL